MLFGDCVVVVFLSDLDFWCFEALVGGLIVVCYYVLLLVICLVVCLVFVVVLVWFGCCGMIVLCCGWSFRYGCCWVGFASVWCGRFVIVVC